MKTTFNEKSNNFTISNITGEQMQVLSYLVNQAKFLTTGQHEENILKEQGFINLGEIGCITLEKEEVETLHSMSI